MSFKKAFFLLLCPLPLFAEIAPYIPWLTGPFLAPTPTNTLPGHPYFQPSLLISQTYGTYDKQGQTRKTAQLFSANSLFSLGVGLTEQLGLELTTGAIYNLSQKRSALLLQDTILYLGYQLTTDQKNSWIPNIRFILQEIFPTGKYQKFSPSKQTVETTGEGSFQTGPVLAIQKLFPFLNHYLSLELSFGYLFPTKVHVKGLNTYGGGHHTRGTIHPGQSFFTFFSGEYSLNQRLVFAFDTYFSYQKACHFSGKSGTQSDGRPASIGLPESIQLSIAPALEYNFSIHSGLLFGTWCTIAGKQADAFASLFCSYVYQF